LDATTTAGSSLRPQPAVVRLSPIHNWIIVVTLAASAVVAWMHIRSTSIWYDEAITLLTTSGHATMDWSLGMLQFKPTANLSKILSQLYEHDVHPPLYFWTLAIWRVLIGQSLEVARALSALFTLGTLWTMYRYAIEADIRWPCVPVVIYALSTAGVRYAYNARPYAMATFLIVLTLFLAHRKSKWTGICAATCVATHYFAAFCAGPIVVMECLVRWKSDRHWVLLTVFWFLFCCALVMPLAVHHLGARTDQYLGFGNLGKEVSALLWGSVQSSMPFSLPWPELKWKLWLRIAILFATVGGIWASRRRWWTVPFAYGAFFCGFLLLAVATNKSIFDMPNTYYLGIGAPLLALLMSYGVNAVPWASPVLGIALLGGMVTAARMPATTLDFRTDYRAVLRHIRSECDHCPILVGAGSGRGVPGCVLYEARGSDVYLLRASDKPEEVIERIGREQTIYLIPANERTMQVERELIQTFSAIPEDTYFKIEARH